MRTGARCFTCQRWTPDGVVQDGRLVLQPPEGRLHPAPDPAEALGTWILAGTGALTTSPTGGSRSTRSRSSAHRSRAHSRSWPRSSGPRRRPSSGSSPGPSTSPPGRGRGGPREGARPQGEAAAHSRRLKAEAKAEREAAADLARYLRESPVVPPVSQWDNPGTPTGQTGVRTPRPDPTRPDPFLPSSEKGGAADASTAPSPFCPKHPTGSDRPCRPCGDARRAHDAWTPPATPARSVRHIPGLCDDHRQPEDDCEICEYENRRAAEVIRGRFAAA
jgi:hypothetical protein